MEVTFKEKKVNYLEGFFAGPLLSKKYLSDVAVKDLAKSDKIRKHPIGIGPYKVTKVVQGEAVQLEKFNDYWQGKPSLDKINLKVIDQTQIVKAMKNGEIDMTDSTTGSIAQEAKNLEMVNLKYYQHQAQTILLLVLYLMIMIKRRIKLVQNVLNIKKRT